MLQAKSIMAGLVVTALGACAVAAPQNFPAQDGPTAIERVVATDVETTWNALVSGIEGRDFEITSTVEENRTIKVLVQSATPSRFVDCGEITVRTNHPDFGERNYNFPAANSARYLVADERTDALIDVERKTSLNALASVRLAPTGDGTLVRISTYYVMSFRTREFGNDIEARDSDSRLDFPTLGGASQEEKIRVGARSKAVTVECRPTGELERRIVALLGEAAG